MRRARFRRRFVHSHGAAAGRVRESSATELSPFTREGTVCIRAVVGDFANDFEKIGHRKAFVFAVKLALKQSFGLPKREKVYLIHEFPRADAPALLFYRFKLGIEWQAECLEVSKWRGKERFGRTGERCLMMSDLSAFKTREREGMLLNSTSIRLW